MNRDADTVPARHETPDLAELRRIYEEAMRVGSNEMAWDEWTTAISEAAEDLFDAAAERDALAADADKWQRAALTLQGDRDALLDELDELRLPYYPRPGRGAPAVKRKPIPAAQWRRNASETFEVVAEYLAMAKRAELRDVGHDCGHEFTVTVVSRGHYTVVGDPTHKDAQEWAAGDYVPMTIKVRAHSLRDALLLAAAEPLAEWVMPDEDEEPQPS